MTTSETSPVRSFPMASSVKSAMMVNKEEVYELPAYLTTPAEVELFFDMSDEQQAIMRGADNLLDGLRAVSAVADAETNARLVEHLVKTRNPACCT